MFRFKVNRYESVLKSKFQLINPELMLKNSLKRIDC